MWTQQWFPWFHYDTCSTTNIFSHVSLGFVKVFPWDKFLSTEQWNRHIKGHSHLTFAWRLPIYHRKDCTNLHPHKQAVGTQALCAPDRRLPVQGASMPRIHAVVKGVGKALSEVLTLSSCKCHTALPGAHTQSRFQLIWKPGTSSCPAKEERNLNLDPGLLPLEPLSFHDNVMHYLS